MKRYIARFTPQAWIGGYALDLDEPRESWDVTAEVSALPETERRAALVPDSYESDAAREWGDCPSAILEWSGPFYIEIIEESAD